MFAQVLAQAERDRLREQTQQAAQQAQELAQRYAQADSTYRRGTGAMDDRRWEDAVKHFSIAAQQRGPRTDGALYWKAYALNKLGRRDESLAALAELQKDHAQSRWLNDAKVLEIEVRQSSGQPVSPEQESNEELKLYALSGLVHSEPARALPLLEKTLNSTATPKMKERALYVLAQMSTPDSRELLTKIAFGGANPDLQRRAVRFLGESRSKEITAKFAELYSSTSDNALKAEILHAYSRSKDRERLFQAASNETDRNLRGTAMNLLSSVGGSEDLWKIYSSANEDTKLDILRAMHGGVPIEKLRDLAQQEREPKVKREIVRIASHHNSPVSAEFLASLYTNDSYREIRKEILDAFNRQKDAKHLVEIARRETDPELKKAAVRALANMKSKEASDYLLELLK